MDDAMRSVLMGPTPWRASARALSISTVLMLAALGCADPTGPVEGSIRGSVTDHVGVTVANAGIALSGNDEAIRTTISGADGVYTFAGVAPGTYTLAVTPPAGFTIGAGATQSITVVGGAQASAATFVLNPAIPTNGTIRGTVKDNINVAVANATVALTGNGQAARTATTGCDGAYTFADLPPGPYALAVTPPAGFTVGAAATRSVTLASGAETAASALLVTRPAGESAFVSALRGRLAATTADGTFSGAVVVTRENQGVFEGACGLADRERSVPNTMLTQFRVGSMNKMLTAVAVLQLVQAGKVQLDEPFGTYVSNYPNVEMASTVTLHHLLTHTGGTGDIFGPQFNANRLNLRDTDDYLELYGSRALQFEPGSQFSYSNYGFMLLGAVIERVSGMSYDDYVAANVLAPAGMTATGAAPETSVVPDRSVGYMMQGGVLVSNASILPYRGTPAGGWYSTVGDFARFATALLEHRLLDPAHTTLLLSGKVNMGPTDIVQYAYGFMDRFQVGRRLAGHGGGFPGMNGELTFEPAGGYTIVVLSNFDPPTATNLEAWILSNLPSN
jgi:D-alanyl-D-alanine carboxypeptidase